MNWWKKQKQKQQQQQLFAHDSYNNSKYNSDNGQPQSFV